MASPTKNLPLDLLPHLLKASELGFDTRKIKHEQIELLMEVMRQHLQESPSVKSLNLAAERLRLPGHDTPTPEEIVVAALALKIRIAICHLNPSSVPGEFQPYSTRTNSVWGIRARLPEKPVAEIELPTYVTQAIQKNFLSPSSKEFDHKRIQDICSWVKNQFEKSNDFTPMEALIAHFNSNMPNHSEAELRLALFILGIPSIRGPSGLMFSIRLSSSQTDSPSSSEDSQLGTSPSSEADFIQSKGVKLALQIIRGSVEPDPNCTMTLSELTEWLQPLHESVRLTEEDVLEAIHAANLEDSMKKTPDGLIFHLAPIGL